MYEEIFHHHSFLFNPSNVFLCFFFFCSELICFAVAQFCCFPFQLLLFGRIRPLYDLLPPREIKEAKNKQIKECWSEADESPSASRQKQSKTGCLPPELGSETQAPGKFECREIFIKAMFGFFFYSSLYFSEGISTHAQFNHSTTLLQSNHSTGADWKLNRRPQSAKGCFYKQ